MPDPKTTEVHHGAGDPYGGAPASGEGAAPASRNQPDIAAEGVRNPAAGGSPAPVLDRTPEASR